MSHTDVNLEIWREARIFVYKDPITICLSIQGLKEPFGACCHGMTGNKLVS